MSSTLIRKEIKYIQIDGKKYIDAGPENLAQVLELLYEKSKIDPAFQHNLQIAYHFYGQLPSGQLSGGQLSAIQVNFSQNQPHIWYNDIDGRPATKAIQNAVVQFLSQVKLQNLSVKPSQEKTHWYGRLFDRPSAQETHTEKEPEQRMPGPGQSKGEK